MAAATVRLYAIPLLQPLQYRKPWAKLAGHQEQAENMSSGKMQLQVGTGIAMPNETKTVSRKKRRAGFVTRATISSVGKKGIITPAINAPMAGERFR